MPWTTTSSPSSGALGADFRVIFRVISAPKIRRGTVKNQGSPDSRKQPQGPENPDKHTLFSYFAGKTESPPECRFWPATGSSPLFSTRKSRLNGDRSYLSGILFFDTPSRGAPQRMEVPFDKWPIWEALRAKLVYHMIGLPSTVWKPMWWEMTSLCSNRPILR